jgi:hypothetical protein
MRWRNSSFVYIKIDGWRKRCPQQAPYSAIYWQSAKSLSHSGYSNARIRRIWRHKTLFPGGCSTWPVERVVCCCATCSWCFIGCAWAAHSDCSRNGVYTAECNKDNWLTDCANWSAVMSSANLCERLSLSWTVTVTYWEWSELYTLNNGQVIGYGFYITAVHLLIQHSHHISIHPINYSLYHCSIFTVLNSHHISQQPNTLQFISLQYIYWSVQPPHFITTKYLTVYITAVNLLISTDITFHNDQYLIVYITAVHLLINTAITLNNNQYLTVYITAVHLLISTASSFHNKQYLTVYITAVHLLHSTATSFHNNQ